MTAREREARENARSAFGMSGWSDRRNDGLGGGSDRMGGIGGLLSQKNYNISPDGTLSRNNEAIGRVTAYGGVAATPDSYMADPDHLGLSVKTPAYTQARTDMARARSMWGHEQSEKERTEEKRHLEQQINSFLPVNMSPDQRINSVLSMNPSLAPAHLQEQVANYAKTFGQVPLSFGGLMDAAFKGDYRSPEEAYSQLTQKGTLGLTGGQNAILGAVGGLMKPAVTEGVARTAYGMTGNPIAAQALGSLSSLGISALSGGVGGVAQGVAGLLDAARMRNQAYGYAPDGPTSGAQKDGTEELRHLQRQAPPALAQVGGLMSPWGTVWSDPWSA
jgi:hypothetical protein